MNKFSLMRVENGQREQTAAPVLLPAVLSVTAGSVDVISFLELDGLFNVHITGNLVIIAAHMVAGRTANTALLERAEVSSLRPLLLLAVSAAHRLSDPLCLRTVLARLPVCLAFGNGNAERVGADALAVSASSKLMRL